MSANHPIGTYPPVTWPPQFTSPGQEQARLNQLTSAIKTQISHGLLELSNEFESYQNLLVREIDNHPTEELKEKFCIPLIEMLARQILNVSLIANNAPSMTTEQKRCLSPLNISLDRVSNDFKNVFKHFHEMHIDLLINNILHSLSTQDDPRNSYSVKKQEHPKLVHFCSHVIICKEAFIQFRRSLELYLQERSTKSSSSSSSSSTNEPSSSVDQGKDAIQERLLNEIQRLKNRLFFSLTDSTQHLNPTANPDASMRFFPAPHHPAVASFIPQNPTFLTVSPASFPGSKQLSGTRVRPSPNSESPSSEEPDPKRRRLDIPPSDPSSSSSY